MNLHVRIDGDRVVLSNFGRLMNDPRYVDAARDVAGLIDQGHRRFEAELRELSALSQPLLGLLITITRQVRQAGGEVSLAGVNQRLLGYLESMSLEEYWDILPAQANRRRGRKSRADLSQEADP